MKAFPVFAALLVLIPGSLNAQSASPCTTDPEYRQLDFWVGEWDVMNSEGLLVGKSSIRRIVGDCVIFENYQGARGPYEGKSFNIFNRELGKWQQFWVDNEGKVLEFTGEYSDGQMRYEGTSKDPAGKSIQHVMTFTQEQGGRVRQLWKQSTDDGESWVTAFNGLYIPAGETKAGTVEP